MMMTSSSLKRSLNTIMYPQDYDDSQVGQVKKEKIFMFHRTINTRHSTFHSAVSATSELFADESDQDSMSSSSSPSSTDDNDVLNLNVSEDSDGITNNSEKDEDKDKDEDEDEDEDEKNSFFQTMKQASMLTQQPNYDNDDTDIDWELIFEDEDVNEDVDEDEDEDEDEKNNFFQAMKQEAAMMTQPPPHNDNDDDALDWKMSVSAFFQWVTQPLLYLLSSTTTTSVAPSSSEG